MNRANNEKGSFTIEASMIFALLTLVVITLLFTFVYMKQKAELTNAAAFAAQQGAELWLDSRKSMEDGRVDTTKEADNIGYRILDNLLFSSRTYEGIIVEEAAENGKKRAALKIQGAAGLPGRKAVHIGEALCRRLEGMLLKPESTKVRITYANNALRGRLTVEITQEIKLPLVGIRQFFDGKDTLTLSSRSSAAVAEPAEYIRNIDLAMELSKRLGGRLNMDELLNRIRGKKTD